MRLLLTVAALLASRPDAFGLPLDLLAGVDGLDRIITSPHIQKTGLALAGFHEYLKRGRVLVFGESEIRYLESLDVAARVSALRAGAIQGATVREQEAERDGQDREPADLADDVRGPGVEPVRERLLVARDVDVVIGRRVRKGEARGAARWGGH